MSLRIFSPSLAIICIFGLKFPSSVEYPFFSSPWTKKIVSNPCPVYIVKRFAPIFLSSIKAYFSLTAPFCQMPAIEWTLTECIVPSLPLSTISFALRMEGSLLPCKPTTSLYPLLLRKGNKLARLIRIAAQRPLHVRILASVHGCLSKAVVRVHPRRHDNGINVFICGKFLRRRIRS
jgi:hypothetical protein